MIVLDKRAVYFHIPKTAGTSMQHTLKRAGLCFYVSPEAKRRNHARPRDFDGELLEVFRAFLFFTIVRNPWERNVSWWAFSGRRMPFERFLLDLLDPPPQPTRMKWHLPRTQSEFFRPPDVFDMVLRFEHLDDDFRELKRRLEIPAGLELPRVNASEHQHYSTYYTPELIDLVGENEAPLIERFGYRY